MKKKNQKELQIYEFLGIKQFRKILFKILYIVSIPFTLKMTKEERIFKLSNTPSNYIMKKGNGLQDLKDFKKSLLLNTLIHTTAILIFMSYLLILGLNASLFSIINSIVFIFINAYCLMLQRYNQIRINQVIQKGMHLEEMKKNKLKEELKKEETLVNDYTISFEELLDTMTYAQLKQYYDYFCRVKEENRKSFDEEQPKEISLQMQKIKK